MPLLTELETFLGGRCYNYAAPTALEQLHPDNRRLRDEIRRQLQAGFLFARICVCPLPQRPDAKRLRAAKLLIHAGSGVWRLP